MSLIRPDEIIHFSNNPPIEINYWKTKIYQKCRSYDAKVMSQGFVWHQIVVQHGGRVRGMDGSREILNAIFDIVAGEEFFPVAYRHGSKEDRFLVRQCQSAMDKLFANDLRIQLSNATFLNLQIQLNVADFKFEQISPPNKIAIVLSGLYSKMITVSGEDNILNLSRFAAHTEFKDIIINLGNRSVFERVCELIYRDDDKFRKVNGMVLSQNRISSLAPMQTFTGIRFGVLDLRDNELRSATRLCRDLKDVKADHLFLAGNPITKSSSYPESIKPVFKNFKTIDGIPVENLYKDYTPMDYDVDIECDGYRIDWSNKLDMNKFRNSDDWHAVMIPDVQQEFDKEAIFDYLFLSVSPELTDFYPCYYKYSSGEHQFLVRQCFEQLHHLVTNCNLEINIPRLSASPPEDDEVYACGTHFNYERTLVYYLRMDISPFKHGQVQPLEVIEKALSRRFSAMDRMLNLENFQSTEGLENIVVNMSSPKILNRVLTQASRKYLLSCIELRLGRNKILGLNFPKTLSLMANLKAMDLSNNWIHDLIEIKDLKTLGLKSLCLDGNPLCAKYAFAGEYIKAVKCYFPDITRLDNIEITQKGNLSSQKNFLCNVRGYDFVDQFVPRYFKTFESKERLSLRGLYHPKAIFTMTCNFVATTKTAQNMKRIAKYTESARNITKMPDFTRAYTTVHMGPDEIMQVFEKLPSMMHDVLTFVTDTTVFNESMTAITVNGLYVDQAPTILDTDMLMGFSRTFLMKPVGHDLGILKCATAYQIINEQFNVFNPTATQIKNAFKYYKSDGNNSTDITVRDKEAMLVMFRQIAGIKSIWCTRCLEDANWDFPRALEIFFDLNERKNEIPNAAFD